MSPIQKTLRDKYLYKELSNSNTYHSSTKKRESIWGETEEWKNKLTQRNMKKTNKKNIVRKTTAGLMVNDLVDQIFNQDLDDAFFKPLFTSPSTSPSTTPSISMTPSTIPSASPTLSPSDMASDSPSNIPSLLPSVIPSSNPTVYRSSLPSLEPSITSIPSTPGGTDQISSIMGKDDSGSKKNMSKSPLFFVLVASLALAFVGFICFYDFEKKSEVHLTSDSPHLKTIIVTKSGYSDEMEVDLFQDEVLNLKIDSGYLVRARGKKGEMAGSPIASSIHNKDWA